MSTSSVPALFVGLVDDAAVFPPGSAPLAEAVAAHREHRDAWYAPVVGPLLVPVADAASVVEYAAPGLPPTIGLIGPTEQLRPRLAVASAGAVSQVEAPVAKRGEDPMPGLAELMELAGEYPDLDTYAEIPLTWGLMEALDRIAQARADGLRVAPKFRTGGLAAELFPTPGELAGVICACRERALRFKLTAGLHRAIRHNDPETGFVHHGFGNVLAACLLAAAGAPVVEVTEHLATTDPVPLIEVVRANRAQPRPLWAGFGSCSVAEPVADLVSLRLLAPDGAA